MTYILKVAKIYHSLIPPNIQSFACDYAKVNEIKFPDSWSANEMEFQLLYPNLKNHKSEKGI